MEPRVMLALLDLRELLVPLVPWALLEPRVLLVSQET